MSGAGAPDEKPVDCHDLRVAVVAARWHEQVMDGLLAGARRALADYQVEAPERRAGARLLRAAGGRRRAGRAAATRRSSRSAW